MRNLLKKRLSSVMFFIAKILMLLACTFPFEVAFSATYVNTDDIFYKGEREFNHLEIDSTAMSTVTSILQDKSGVMWFAHQSGMRRFDGIEYKIFTFNPDDEYSIAPGYVMHLTEAKDGRIWVSMRASGLSVFDPVTEKFTHYRYDENTPTSLVSDRLTMSVEDNNGNIWVGSHDGLSVLNVENGQFRRYLHEDNNPNSLLSNYVRTLQIDHQGRIWIGTDKGLNLFRPETNDFVDVASNHEHLDSLSNQFIYAMEVDASNRLWIGTNKNGAAWLDLDSFDLHRLPVKPEGTVGGTGKWITDFLIVNENEVWISTFGNGIAVVDTRKMRVSENINHNPAFVSSLKSQLIFKMYQSGSGLIWIATWGSKLSTYHPVDNARRYLVHNKSDPTTLSSNNISEILELRSRQLLFANLTPVKLDLFDPKKGRIKTFSIEQGLSLPSPIRGLLELSDGSILILTIENPPYRYWLDTGRLQQLEFPTKDPIVATSFIQDGDDNVWLGTKNGLFHWSIGSNVMKPVTQLKHTNSPFNHEVVAMTMHENGDIWLGTSAGLYYFSKTEQGIIEVTTEQPELRKFIKSRIKGVKFNQQKELIFTSTGVYRLSDFDGKNGGLQVIEKTLRGGLYIDSKGNYWFTYTRITPSGQRTSFPQRYNGQNVNTWIYSEEVTDHETIMMGAVNGVSMIKPTLYQPREYNLPIVVRSLIIDGQLQQNSAPSQLVLAPTTKNLQIRFAALDFSLEPEKITYQYQLEGFDNEWTTSSSAEPMATYTSIPPGKYTLVVRNTGRNDKLNSNTLRIPITQLPYWHQTLWFKILAALSLITLVGLFFQLRILHLERRQKVLQQLVAEKTHELEEKNKKLEAVSLSDQLTNTNNRHFFARFMPQEIKQLHRKRFGENGNKNEYIGFIVLDMDFFKQVNDNYGHNAGDTVLAQLGKIIKGTVREQDWVIRWGGEEFLIVCRSTTLPELKKLAERIRIAINHHDFVIDSDMVLKKTCSIGLSIYPFADENESLLSAEETIDIADSAMYIAKTNGRNAWVSIESALAQLSEEQKKILLADVSSALESALVNVDSSIESLNRELIK
jgi:diguanylate cyclase (GGDEF)-like protein